MTEVDFVRSRPGGRVTIQFEPHQAVLITSPIRWADWVRWFWLCVGASLILAWIGFLAYQFGAPREVALVFAVPGGVFLGIFILYITILFLYTVFTLGFGRSSLTRFGNWVDKHSAPRTRVGTIAFGTVVNVSATRRFRRSIVKATFSNGHNVSYTRWGARYIGRILAEGFQTLSTQRHPSFH